MIARRLGSINRNQAGFTGLEMVIAIALAGIIGGAALMTTLQLIQGMDRSTNYVQAISQVQSAGYWVSHDAQMAQDVVVDSDADGLPMTLTWEDWDSTNGNRYIVTYSLEVDVSGVIVLQRRYEEVEIATDSTVTDETTIVARYIDSDPSKTNCVWDDDVDKLTFTVTATVGADTPQEASKTRTYEILPRPAS